MIEKQISLKKGRKKQEANSHKSPKLGLIPQTLNP
jgi:hypothetical protein